MYVHGSGILETPECEIDILLNKWVLRGKDDKKGEELVLRVELLVGWDRFRTELHRDLAGENGIH